MAQHTRTSSSYIGMRIEKKHIRLIQNNMNGVPEYGIIWGEDEHRFIIESWVRCIPIQILPSFGVLIPTMLFVSKQSVYDLGLDVE